MELINIGDAFLNNYIIKAQKGLIVVDTGMKGGFDKFKRRFLKKGLKFSDIKYIFITHSHYDHVGFLDQLAGETDAKIILHKIAAQRIKTAEFITEGVYFSKRGLFFKNLMTLYGEKIIRFTPVDLPQRYLIYENNEQYFKQIGIDIEIIALPGHTPDCIGLLIDNNIICGDAAMNNFLSLKRCSIMIEDINSYKKSWGKMIELDCKKVYPSHGIPFDGVDLIKFIKNLNKLV